MTNLDEAVVKAQQGDKDSISAIYNELFIRCRKIGIYRLKHYQLGEDTAQEIVTNIMLRFLGIINPPTFSALFAYSQAAMSNKIRDIGRRRQKTINISLEYILNKEDDRWLESRMGLVYLDSYMPDIEQILQYLNERVPKYADIIVESANGKTDLEISKILDLPLGTVKRNLRRVREVVRNDYSNGNLPFM